MYISHKYEVCVSPDTALIMWDIVEILSVLICET